MSDSELIAIILGTGTRGANSIRVAEYLLAKFGQVGKLGLADLEDVANTKGVGNAKAAQIIAAIELGKRVSGAKAYAKPYLTSPDKVAEMLVPEMRYLEKEHFKALILNTRNQLLKSVDVSVGGLNAAIIRPRELYRLAIKANGAGMIVAHNHPSGDVTPSREDIVLTRRLAEAGRILGIDFVDHIIVGDDCWLSLKEKGYLSTGKQDDI